MSIRNESCRAEDSRTDRGYVVAWTLQAWLGHKNIQHTVRYTELAPDLFKDFWR
jgi:DNA-binding transcriptional regulator of glucitol operon